MSKLQEKWTQCSSKDCNKYLQEKLILKTMAEHGGSYVHVLDLFPSQARKSFAQASQDNQTPKKVIPKKVIVTKLIVQVMKIGKEPFNMGAAP